MIVGTVSDDDTPIVVLEFANREWPAIVDTGFNGDLELPEELRSLLPHEYMGQATSYLAAGQTIKEDAYFVIIPFDGEMVGAAATFVAGNGRLIGTHLLRQHRLEVNFSERTVLLERV